MNYQDELRKSLLSGGPRTYTYSGDSALLRFALRRYCGTIALEIGFGGGSILESLSERFQLAVGTDLRSEPVQRIIGPCDALVADRASCFRDSVFDIVVFNPPYLPSESIEDVAADGGKGGIQVPLFFLEEAERVVKKDGKILALLSSLSERVAFETRCKEMNLDVKVIAERSLFFETLYVYELTKR